MAKRQFHETSLWSIELFANNAWFTWSAVDPYSKEGKKLLLAAMDKLRDGSDADAIRIVPHSCPLSRYVKM